LQGSFYGSSHFVLQSALATLDQPTLSAEVMAACDEVYAPLRGAAATYTR
jgi:hypothetical protein